jgi:hypothetical protein
LFARVLCPVWCPDGFLGDSPVFVDVLIDFRPSFIILFSYVMVLLHILWMNILHISLIYFIQLYSVHKYCYKDKKSGRKIIFDLGVSEQEVILLNNLCRSCYDTSLWGKPVKIYGLKIESNIFNCKKHVF